MVRLMTTRVQRPVEGTSVGRDVRQRCALGREGAPSHGTARMEAVAPLMLAAVCALAAVCGTQAAVWPPACHHLAQVCCFLFVRCVVVCFRPSFSVCVCWGIHMNRCRYHHRDTSPVPWRVWPPSPPLGGVRAVPRVSHPSHESLLPIRLARVPPSHTPSQLDTPSPLPTQSSVTPRRPTTTADMPTTPRPPLGCAGTTARKRECNGQGIARAAYKEQQQGTADSTNEKQKNSWEEETKVKKTRKRRVPHPCPLPIPSRSPPPPIPSR